MIRRGRISERFFRWVILAYPRRLRQTRGAEMWLTFESDLKEAREAGRLFGTVLLWVQECATALLQGTRARLRNGALRHNPHNPNSSLEESVFNILQDIRYAIRTLTKSPGFAFTVIGMLAIGIGASSAMFTVVRGVMLTPLGFERPEELVSVWLRDNDSEQSTVPPADFLDLGRLSGVLTEVAGRWSANTSLLGDGEPEQVSVAWVSSNYMSTLGIRPALGRVFGPDEADAVVISDGLWRRRYGADSSMVGRTVRLGDDAMVVVGVLPRDINPNVATVGGARERNEVFRLWPAEQWLGDDRVTGWIRVVARAKPGVTSAAIDADMRAVTEEILKIVPERRDTGFEIYAIGLLDELVRAARPYLLTLAGGVAFVFFIACFNVANLSMVRSHRRGRELAVRAAIGAGRGTLVRQPLAESVTLATLGGLGGVGIAHLATRGLIAFQPANVPRLDTIQVDAGVLFFAIAASLLAAVIGGVFPGWRAASVDPGAMLHERTATGTRGQHGIARALIASEVALSLVLLTGSGLLFRTFVQLAGVNPGFETDRLITYSVTPSAIISREWLQTFTREVIDKTKVLPGVEHVAFTNRFPFAGGIFDGPYATEEQFASDAPKHEASFRWITGEFFDAMGANLLAGRTITESDGPDVVVVDDVMARIAWPEEDPIGKRVWTGALGRNGEWSTVVGVVQQMRHNDLMTEGQETIFIPGQSGRLLAAVRTSGATEGLIPSLRQVLRSIDPDATMGRPQTADELLGNTLAPTRFAMLLIAAFAGVAVLLAAVGIFSVVSFAVRERTREFGLRMALGEPRPRVFRSVVVQSLAVSAIGIAAGLIGVALLTQFIQSMLYGVEPLDLATISAGAFVMITIGVLGGLLPALRAARVDPMAALRME